jgi:hypothetical protein
MTMFVFKDSFLNAAEFRRQKATEYPDDSRNLEAARLLEKLAATADAVDPALIKSYGELYDSEVHADMLRQIGFHIWPDTATEFVQDFIASRA